ncbi:MAG: hypothetical protein II404_13720 [Prevotella sp.]|nr:hypothetical protein [Prevotella sp.]
MTVAGSNATVSHGGKRYFASGATATLTVDDANKAFKTFSVSGATYSVAANKKSATVTVPTADITVTATLTQIPVSYLDASGEEQTCTSCTVLQGSETTLPEGTYVVFGDITYTGTVTLDGDVTLILADGCHMNIGTENNGITGNGITNGIRNLTITSQSLSDSMGALSVYITGNNNRGILAYNLTINGGNVTVTVTGSSLASAIRALGNYTFNWRNATDRITIGSTGLYATDRTATFARLFKDASDNYYGGTLTGSDLSTLSGVTLSAATQLVLADTDDNSARLAAANSMTGLDVQLQNRTLLKGNTWNTLCLPFSMTSAEIAASPLAGATIKELDATTSLENGVLTLKFNTATSIEAGKPYIIKWTDGESISNPVSSGVTIDNSAEAQARMTVTSNDGKVKFVGQYSPFSITADNINSILYLASGNRIGYSSKDRELKCFRAHFWVQPNGMQQAASMISIDFGDSETTEIKTTNFTNDTNSDGAMYDLQGRQVTKPQKGLYIVNGRKVLVK